MRTELLRFNGAVERDPAIDAWMKEHAGELGAIAHQWFEVMRKCGDEVQELLHDGCHPMSLTATAPKRARRRRSKLQRILARRLGLLLLMAGGIGVAAVALQARYTFTMQSPVRIRFQSPLVIAPRDSAEESGAAQADQFGHRLTAYQQYACNKFGSACRIALAVQRAENRRGACEIYHYNSDGTLDWGYFQINTVHLKRAGVNLRDLLDCKANIDLAYQLYTERGFEPWTTFNNGAYRQFLRKL